MFYFTFFKSERTKKPHSRKNCKRKQTAVKQAISDDFGTFDIPLLITNVTIETDTD